MRSKNDREERLKVVVVMAVTLSFAASGFDGADTMEKKMLITDGRERELGAKEG